ncbi:MAG: hypothetical protein GTO41_05340 [Burkholderiales bacterium]|nr:hypothetical protein [Burkholderiales bacterium]
MDDHLLLSGFLLRYGISEVLKRAASNFTPADTESNGGGNHHRTQDQAKGKIDDLIRQTHLTQRHRACQQ